MFKIGQTVVHLSYGISTIRGFEERQFGTKPAGKFYVLEIEDNGVLKKVFVDTESASERIRHLIDKKTATDILAYLALGKRDEKLEHQTWNRRYREYMELLHTGDAMNIGKVYVSLRMLEISQNLSFGERKLLDHAKTLLTKEFEAIGIKLPKF